MSILARPVPRVFAPLLAPGRYKGAHGGRGSGKSHFFAEMLVGRCLKARTDAVCVREIQKSLKQSVKKLIEGKIQSMGVSDQFEVLETEIRGPHGSLIIFQGMQNHTADTIKSLENYNVAWVEEAQSLSQVSLDLLRPTIRAPGSELWFSWNPKKATDPVDVLLRGEDPPPGSIVVQANYADNPWLPEELRADMEYDRRRDQDKFKHVWLGGYDDKSDAQVFKNWTVEEFEPPKDAVFRFGADWGFAQDPTVLVRSWIDGRNLYIDHEAWMVGCEIDNHPALFDSVPEARRFLITADSARPEVVSYMQRNGYPKIVPAIKGPGSVEDGIDFLKTYDIIVHPRCKHVIDELGSYSYRIDKKTDLVTSDLEDRHNHTIDALRYACEGARRAGKASPDDDYEEQGGELSWME